MRMQTWLAVGIGLAVLPELAEAQRPTRRQAPIEIRGQVPTPQVVTVRPRAMPTYSRQVLVPNFYDHDFWSSILPGYQLVPKHVISGGTVRSDAATDSARVDSTRAGSTSPAVGSSTGTMGSTPTPASGTAPADTTRRQPGTAPAKPER